MQVLVFGDGFHTDEGASLRELAVEIGCSIRAIRKALAEAQVTPRPLGRWVNRLYGPFLMQTYLKFSGHRY